MLYNRDKVTFEKYISKKIGAIVQARMGSERLPGKSLAKVGGKPLVKHILENLKDSKYLKEIVLATTKRGEDTILVKLAKSLNVCGFTGSESDVLLRYLDAAKAFELDVVVRVTGDNILTDINGMDKAISLYLKEEPDLITNGGEGGYPIGTGVEVFSTNLLQKLSKIARSDEEREHVTLHVHRRRDKYRVLNLKAPVDYRNLNIRLTIDTPEDLLLIRRLYQGLKECKKDFKLPNIIAYLSKHQELKKINCHIKQRIF